MPLSIVIVGAGLAGLSAADTLREQGYDGRILLVGDEPDLPYSRPPLSKAVLRGEMDPSEPAFRDAAWYDDNRVELLLGQRAAAIDSRGKAVQLADGTRLEADAVLLATGGPARSLDAPGADLAGVHTLRTMADALAIRARLEPGAPVVVVGAGFIGAEVAASARKVGCEVTILEVAPLPLGRVLGAELGQVYARIHREEGVELRTGVGVDRIEGDSEVRQVVASDGQVHEAQLVVVGVGIVPDVSIVPKAVEIGNGVLVDEHCRTSVPGIYAAGDIAHHPNPILGRSIRVEQWQNAQHQGAAAARSMLGGHDPFSEVPWFWSDQYDVNLQMAGLPSADSQAVFRGAPESRSFSAFYLRDGVLEGVVGLNRLKDVRMGRRLIAEQARVDPSVLADESTNLADLVPIPL